MITFTIWGPPRTKKNHGRVIKRGNRKFHVPSAAHETWANKAIGQLMKQAFNGAWNGDYETKYPIVGPVNVRAHFYREKLIGDAVGFYQALADALETARILENDRQIVSWDGSRLLKDAERPRIELWITPETERGSHDQVRTLG